MNKAFAIAIAIVISSIMFAAAVLPVSAGKMNGKPGCGRPGCGVANYGPPNYGTPNYGPRSYGQSNSALRANAMTKSH